MVDFFQTIRGKLILSLGIAVIVIAVLLGFIFLRDTPEPVVVGADFSIQAEKMGESGLEPDSGFYIQTDINLSLNDFRTLIYITPQQDFSLKKDAGGYYLKPKEPLQPNTLYNLGIQQGDGLPPLTWAFQTKGEFTVVSTMPGENTDYVPLNSGIEITLSQRCTDLADHFLIEPAVDGDFEVHGKTVAFIPKENLAPNTIYTVMIKQGATSDQGISMKESYAFAFRTERTNYDEASTDLYLLNNFTETFLSDDPVAVELHAAQLYEGKNFQVNVYPLQDANQYLDLAQQQREHVNRYIGRSRDYFLPTDGLNKQIEFTATLAKGETGDWYPGYIVLPENPGPGWYLLDIICSETEGPAAGKHVQKLIQISDLSVYAQSSNGEHLFWLHNSQTGTVLANATITLKTETETLQAKSDAEGLSRLQASSAQSGRLIIQGEGLQYGELLWLEPAQEPTLQESYYTYIYTDRQAYQPNDTVKFWGFVQPRQKGVAIPDTLTLDWSGADAQEQSIEVQKNGSFQGSFTFANQRSGSLPLQLKIADTDLLSTYVTIMEYTKPAYIIDAVPSQEFYRRGQDITVDVSATFFDGTPASHVSLRSYPQSQNSTLQTDSTGYVQVVFPYPDSNRDAVPRFFNYSFNTAGAEEENVYVDGNVLYFPSDYVLQAEAVMQNNGSQIKLTTNALDFSKYPGQEEIYTDFPGPMTGKPVEMSGSITIQKIQYNKYEVGESYDFIQKKKVKRYEYRSEESVVETIPFTTTNGSFETAVLPYSDKEPLVYYQAIIHYTTPTEEGASFEKTIYLGTPGWWADDSELNSYAFRPDREDYDTTFKENENIPIYVSNRGERITEQNGQLLYTLNTAGMIQQDVIQTTSFQVSYDESLLPNYQIYGAYFDGKHIYTVTPLYLSFTPEDRALSLQVSTDKESYRPGEKAKITVAVKDAKGEPTAAHILLSVADEAAFAVMDQVANPLHEVYDTLYYYPTQSFASYIQHVYNGMTGGAEGGGDGGGEGPRRNFKDTAAFVSLEAGMDGIATAEVELPDNLTSWRLTSLAYTDAIEVGNTTANLKVTQPFFIHGIWNKTYLSQDDVTGSLRAFGSEIPAQQEVSYTVTIQKPTDTTTKQTFQYQGKCGDFTFCNLGPLSKGDYLLTLTAQSGDAQDSIEQTFSVVDSLLEVCHSKVVTPAELSNISPSRFPIRLILFDLEQQRYFQALSNMLSNTTERADQRIAADLAQEKLAVWQGNEPLRTKDDTLGNIQDDSGGVRLFPYSDPDVELTAKLVAAAPQYFNTDLAKNYFYRVLNERTSTTGEMAAAYMGLAALKEPVLYDLRQLLAESETLALTEQMTYATALALCGDTTSAQSWYDSHVAPEIQSKENGTKYLAGAADEAGNLEKTGKATFLAIAANHQDATFLLDYLLDYQGNEYLSLSEQLFYVSRYTAQAGGQAAYSYVTSDGKTILGDFQEEPCAILEISEKTLASLDLQQIAGNLGISVYYVGGTADLSNQHDGITISKTLTPQSDCPVGGIIRVDLQIHFDAEAPDGWYQLSDIIPSGCRFSKAAEVFPRNWYLDNQENQRLSFSLTTNQMQDGQLQEVQDVTITYYIRGVLPGNYQVEPAILQHTTTGVNTQSETSRLTVVK